MLKKPKFSFEKQFKQVNINICWSPQYSYSHRIQSNKHLQQYTRVPLHPYFCDLVLGLAIKPHFENFCPLMGGGTP